MYDPWLPVGWRLGGTLSAEARIGGRLGAPTYAGRIQGRQLAVSHFVEGVRVRDGELEATLAGDRLRIERFVAHAGGGVARIEGGARLGARPSAQLSLSAERFQALSRVDRRITLSGQARLALDPQRARLQGRFVVDDGLIDLGRGEAPELSNDVRVVDDPRHVPLPAGAAASGTTARTLQMDLRVDLGGHLRVQGRGVNTPLAGDVRVTAPGGALQLHGTVRTEQGSYQAYGEKLRIERGLITFTGPVADPRLDIQAVRPDLRDVEVGVAISGTAQNPRVRLTSTPEMSELDKLSWLTMGRASEGLAKRLGLDAPEPRRCRPGLGADLQDREAVHRARADRRHHGGGPGVDMAVGLNGARAGTAGLTFPLSEAPTLHAMRVLARLVLVWLIALALPVQGVAGVTMLHCAPSHHPAQAAPHHHHAAQGAAPAHAGHGASMAHAHQAADKGGCSACAACCAGAALAVPATPPALVLQDARQPVLAAVGPPPAAFITGGPERPPRPVLA